MEILLISGKIFKEQFIIPNDRCKAYNMAKSILKNNDLNLEIIELTFLDEKIYCGLNKNGEEQWFDDKVIMKKII
ncbi:MAG: hypothetical protein LBM96_05845 [Methanobrevibacter sp.]|jgi:hypothetical protein|nr:hypothetical protein [Candidatus Methanoflexus mossambicus]